MRSAIRILFNNSSLSRLGPNIDKRELQIFQTFVIFAKTERARRDVCALTREIKIKKWGGGRVADIYRSFSTTQDHNFRKTGEWVFFKDFRLRLAVTSVYLGQNHTDIPRAQLPLAPFLLLFIIICPIIIY